MNFFCSRWNNVSSFCVHHVVCVAWMEQGNRLFISTSCMSDTSVHLTIPHLSMEMISVPPWTADTEHWLLFSLCSYLNNIFFLLGPFQTSPSSNREQEGNELLVQSLGGDKGENLPKNTSLGDCCGGTARHRE